MNSALQALLHNEIIKQFFLGEKWQNQINLSNPLGTRGEFSKSFADLLGNYWFASNYKVIPRNFKFTMQRHLTTFEGYGQHDSQEFFSQVLDTLH